MLRKIATDQVQGMVVLPEWPSAPWWPQFLEMRGKSITSEAAVYLTDAGNLLQPPSWKTNFAILSGQRLRSQPRGPNFFQTTFACERLSHLDIFHV